MRSGGLGPARLMLPKRARPAPALCGRRRPRNSRGRLGDQCLPAQAAAKSGELQRDLRCVIPHANVIAQPLNPVLQLKNLFHAADRSAWFGTPKHAFRKRLASCGHLARSNAERQSGWSNYESSQSSPLGRRSRAHIGRNRGQGPKKGSRQHSSLKPPQQPQGGVTHHDVE